MKAMYQALGQTKQASNESGFSLPETVIALVIMMIVGLGAAALFVYALNNNSGAGDRELAKAVAQQQMERLRDADFGDPSLVATTGTTQNVTSADRQYSVLTTITDVAPVSPNIVSTLKTITVQVTPLTAGPMWSRNPVVMMTQRADTSTGLFLLSIPVKKKKK